MSYFFPRCADFYHIKAFRLLIFKCSSSPNYMERVACRPATDFVSPRIGYFRNGRAKTANEHRSRALLWKETMICIWDSFDSRELPRDRHKPPTFPPGLHVVTPRTRMGCDWITRLYHLVAGYIVWHWPSATALNCGG